MAIVGLLLVASCGGRGGGGGGGFDAGRRDAGPRPDGALPDEDAGAGDGGGSEEDAGGGERDGGGMPIAFCRLGCSTSSDCTTPSAAFDADNYACEGSACVYRGCNTDAECASSFSDSRYACRDTGGGIRTCNLRCAAASDCSTASPAFDADNYTCESNTCVYQGCNTDDECRASFADARYGCREVTPPDVGVPLPRATRNCVLTCATSSDCSTPSAAFDADNYRCESNTCIYEGCNTDTECASSFSDTRYVCR